MLDGVLSGIGGAWKTDEVIGIFEFVPNGVVSSIGEAWKMGVVIGLS